MPPHCVRGGIFRSYLSALLLLCLLGFESQDGVAAAQVDAALLVDVRHLDDDGITHSNNIFHALDTLGVQLGDVDEALLARSDLDESTEVHQTGDLALVDSTDLGVFHDGPDNEKVMFSLGLGISEGGSKMGNFGVNFALDRSRDRKAEPRDIIYTRKEVDNSLAAQDEKIQLLLAKVEEQSREMEKQSREIEYLRAQVEK